MTMSVIGLSIDCADAATLAGNHGAVAFRKNHRQRPSLLGSQPQTQQVALALRLGPILEGGAIVQERVVMHQLNVALL